MNAVPRWLWIALAAVLALGIAFYMGKRTGQIDQKLVQNQAQIDTNTTQTKVDSAKVDTAKKHVAELEAPRTVIRGKVRVVHDTVNVGVKIIVDSTLATLIQADDSLIAAQKVTIGLQDTLIKALRVGSTLRDTRIKLLESKGVSRISKGFQGGVGYCASAKGNAPCLYVGYGVGFRLP